ncbi:hypothetical protein O59_000166 [Cellvibrio sp. BR]|nr:hypothetical protein O59_000166 [Cellvibrio sp. BR]
MGRFLLINCVYALGYSFTGSACWAKMLAHFVSGLLFSP